MTGPDRFRFLSVERRIVDASDWNRADWPRLWLYNLHYFDDLVADGAAARQEWHRALIRRWIAENPPASGNGWEPYPTSLRLVNWSKWLLAGNEPVDGMLDSMAVQDRFLRKRLERHLLGNHLWANLKALVFAGTFFEGLQADRWREPGLRLLAREINEQILADGGHFERSPMYHAILLEDLLDLIQLDGVFPGVLPDADVLLWREKAGEMLGWLQAMTHPDGEISFFNDAAFGIAPVMSDLLEYSRAIELDWQPGPLDGVVRFSPSGYVRLQRGSAVALIDAAPIGPDYLPGHAHADTLSFELSLGAQRVIVNSGIDRYTSGAERQFQRSTAAHSTVEVDGEDSSEVWSSFRVARRARPIGLRVSSKPDAIRAECGHDGYRRLPGKVIHFRSWTLSDECLRVHDRLSGQFRQAIARFYLHPGVSCEMSDHQVLLETAEHQLLISFQGGTPRLVAARYFPRFGEHIPNYCIEVFMGGAELVSEITLR